MKSAEFDIRATDYSVTSSQIGWITESVVGANLIARSGGRIAPFTPVADDCGVDLLAMDKASGRTVALQVKAWTRGPSTDQTIQFDIRKSTFNAFSYFIGVWVPLPELEIAYAWFLPMRDVPDFARDARSHLIVRCSTGPNTRDKMSLFRMDSEGLVAAIQATLA
ncbi:MAG: hypothetical protein RIM33_11730 [Alphaproteobacteria bacterium]